MTYHRRRLPHIYPEGTALFLTWHLHGSVPTSLLRPPSKLTSGEAFLWLDRQLDTMRHGPMYLRQPAIAQIVVDSIHKGAELGHYELSTLCSDGQSCPPAYSSLDQPRSPPEIAQGRERATCQSFVRANRRAILAERILRSLGAKPSRVREDSSIHRKQSGQGRTGSKATGLSLVKRGRRDESRRGTHECVRHAHFIFQLIFNSFSALRRKIWSF